MEGACQQNSCGGNARLVDASECVCQSGIGCIRVCSVELGEEGDVEALVDSQERSRGRGRQAGIAAARPSQGDLES